MTGEKISLKSIPSFCEKPLATSQAFFRPSDFMSKTQQFLTTFLPFSKSVSSKTRRSRRDSNSSWHVAFHSSFCTLGSCRISRKCHSLSREVAGSDLSCSSSGDIAFASRKLMTVLPLPGTYQLVTFDQCSYKLETDDVHSQHLVDSGDFPMMTGQLDPHLRPVARAPGRPVALAGMGQDCLPLSFSNFLGPTFHVLQDQVLHRHH